MSDSDIQRLVERIEGGERSNELDVLIEVALFKPSDVYIAISPNAAGTKVIYTHRGGNVRTTFWAEEHTASPQITLAALRARITERTDDE